MKAELIAVGTEILLGEITDTNTPFIARELANLGIDVYFQSTVGDNPERLKETLKLAARRSDLIILSGGLGPTEDDLTKQTVAKFLNRELIFDKSAMTKIEQYFAETKRTMTENNRLQAMYLKGALPLSNRTGFAVGIFDQEKTGPDFLLLPGPPSELEPMVSEQVIPLLKETYLSDHVLRSRMLRFFGIGESQLTTQLANLISTQSNPTIAPYAKQNEVTLRLTAWSKTNSEAQQALDECEKQIQAQVGEYFYGYGEHNSLAQVLATKLSSMNQNIAIVEGYTGGLFLSTLNAVKADHNIVSGGIVLGTNERQIQQFVDIKGDFKSRVVTEQLATQVKYETGSDLGIAISQPHIESTSTDDHKGNVWIVIVDRTNTITTKRYEFSTIRPFVKQRVVMSALQAINKILK